ncbi:MULTISPECIES: hypothetical protein [Micromonospora]|uniref:hypothetical protein n=1 Tax=Micromonospora TaxID=1873 RepID=UPI0024A372C8|nr:hypothetical protein [Micromonospora sp. NBRC 107095]GLZ61878.1 hypothetical protein Misp05_54540 [Micromonospora sp. NBRC 107095]
MAIDRCRIEKQDYVIGRTVRRYSGNGAKLKAKILATLAVAATAVLAVANPAAAATGDAVLFNNNNTLITFKTADCTADGVFNYLDATITPSPFSVATKKYAGPSWCRYGVSIDYKDSNGVRKTTPIAWSADFAEIRGYGTRCVTNHYIQRPGNGSYVVHLNHTGGGC